MLTIFLFVLPRDHILTTLLTIKCRPQIQGGGGVLEQTNETDSLDDLSNGVPFLITHIITSRPSDTQIY